MTRKRDASFFDCAGCRKVTLLANPKVEGTCPDCGAVSGRVISSAELERRIEAGAVFYIDLSPGGLDKPNPERRH